MRRGAGDDRARRSVGSSRRWSISASSRSTSVALRLSAHARRATCSRAPTARTTPSARRRRSLVPGAGGTRRRAACRIWTSIQAYREAGRMTRRCGSRSRARCSRRSTATAAGRARVPADRRARAVRSGAIVGFHARAYAASAGGDFFDVGGIAFIEGAARPTGIRGRDARRIRARRSGRATNFNLRRRRRQQHVPPRVDDHASAAPVSRSRSRSVRTGELFAVHVSLEAEAVDERGARVGRPAYIQRSAGPAARAADGPRPTGRGASRPSRSRPSRSPKPARCPGGTPRSAGALQLSAPSFSTSEASP